ncbi:MAG: hypothetical protein WBC82_12410 [Dehalococcoidia bacterium]
MEKQRQQAETKEDVAKVKMGEQVEAKEILDKVYKDAYKICKEAQKLADEIYKEAKKLSVDKQAIKEADRIRKEAKKEADKVRDLLIAEATAAFRFSFDEAIAKYDETMSKLK